MHGTTNIIDFFIYLLFAEEELFGAAGGKIDDEIKNRKLKWKYK